MPAPRSQRLRDDKYHGNVHWSLTGHGYVIDGGAHDLAHLDFTTLEADNCETPGARLKSVHSENSFINPNPNPTPNPALAIFLLASKPQAAARFP